jgi:hypothetical protein
MNACRLIFIGIFWVTFGLWCVTAEGAASLSSYPSDPSGHGLGFTRAHVDKLGRLVVFGSASGGPTNDNSIRAFDGRKWAYLWPNAYKNGGAQVRHNHVSFYIPRLNEFWVWGGSHLETLPGALRSGRFSLTEKKWLTTSTSDSGAFDRILQGGTVFLSTMSAAWAGEADMGIMFGGSVEGNATNRQWIIEPNSAGPEPYQIIEFSGPRPPIRTQCMNCMVAVGSEFYLFGGAYQEPGGSAANRRDLWKFDGKKRTWTQLPNAPNTGYQPVLTYDTKANALVTWADNKILLYYIGEQRWSDQTPAGLPCVGNHVGGYLASINAHLYEGGNDCPSGNGRGPQLIGISLGNVTIIRH